MLRALWAYLLVAFAISAVAGLGYGAGVISVPGVYGLIFLACLVAGVGRVRWELRRPG